MPAVLPGQPMSLFKPLRDTWSTSLGSARERLTTGGRRRLLVDWVVQAVVLLLVGQLVPGILVGPVAALLAALVLGLLNALVRPVLILLTLPLTVVTVGLLSLVVNAMMLTLAAPAGAGPRGHLVRRGLRGRRPDHDPHARSSR